MKKIASLVFVIALLCACIPCFAESAESQPLWESGESRDKIIVISDIHLGIDDSFSETVSNKEYLISFLNRLAVTGDVRELVITGDFLDEWYLPLSYPAYQDSAQFYRDVIANNQDVMTAFQGVMAAGVKLTYVPGNHDLLLESGVLTEALPGILQARDVRGLGTYVTGDRQEIAIEHGHRYDVFSAPDTLTNAELCGNDETILPAGYFYARYAASWVIQGRPQVEKNLPAVEIVPDASDIDQMGAYAYYKMLETVAARMTPEEAPDEPIFDVRIAGFDASYTFLDFYPALQADGTISAPVLFRNLQRTWDERQTLNEVAVKSDFITSVLGALDWQYFFNQAKTQYLENPLSDIEIVVFGHTHIPDFETLESGKIYINDGTWVDHNTDSPDYTRTFAVIQTGETDEADLCMYMEDGGIVSIAGNVCRTDAQ